MGTPEFWIGFNIFILAMLALDLFVFNKKSESVSFKQSIKLVGFWTLLALVFNGLLYYFEGKEKAIEFFTGYVIEWSLSVDNLFVFIVIFNYFKVPKEYQHRVLFWGIIGALVLRGAFIFAGIALFNMFEWMIFIFGGVLIISGLKMLLFKEDDDPKLDQNILVRVCKKIFPVTDEYSGDHFFVKKYGKRFITPLFLVLMVVDFTDLVFAADSIPAILSITRDTFIVYTSNVFAILGLRSLYFALSEMMYLFRYLKYGLAVILVFVGVKMVASHYLEIPTSFTLIVVAGVLGISILLSLISNKTDGSK